ncbi:hypothetical protein [Sphingobium sp. Z007]|uniref:hypothetical protein n=1 Tax=Sphingobium sp. Z007 TaxID=627495 RepID=UPI001594F42A|nr:hypothetical protein [Sphingobium sp. Z007]
MVDAFARMTVNERLFAAGLLAAYEAAQADDDFEKINEILGRVGLHQDADGMIHAR